MKHYYFNKVAMAVLVALLLFFGTRTLIDIIYEEDLPETPGYEVAGAEEDAVHGGKDKASDEGAAFILALNKADPAKGEQAVGLCKVCHSFEKGGPTMIGPNLYGVVGHKIAGHEGVNYTQVLKDHGGDWTFENMDAWLKNPQAFAAGTSMAFPGIADIQKRADVIAYLNKNSDDPLPIPEPKAAAPEAGGASEKAAEGGGKPEVLSLLAEADPAKGEQGAALCKVCHTFDAGGGNMVGPNLHNVVGAKIAHHEGFNYSPALKGKAGAWTYENLDAWLKNPQAFAPGTTMAYPGIPDAKKRADMIAFLRSHTENPPPLPGGDAEAAPAEEEAKPTGVEPAAEEPGAEGPGAEGPAGAPEAPVEEEEVTEEDTVVVSPAVSEEAPSEPHKGEPASPNQPQPVVPAKAMGSETPDAAMEQESMDETVVGSPTVSEDAPAEPHMGEPASPNQPQPVVPGEEAADGDSSAMSADVPSGGDGPSSRPQPVYPNGKPDGL